MSRRKNMDHVDHLEWVEKYVSKGKRSFVCFSTPKFSGTLYKASFHNLSIFTKFSVIPSPKCLKF